MSVATPAATGHPVRIASRSGLSVEVNANGSLRRIDHHDITLNLFPGNELDGGPANLYLRCHGGGVAATSLLGPRSASVYQFHGDGYSARGEWRGIDYHVRLVLAQDVAAWFWHVELRNQGDTAVDCDLIAIQDVGLAHYGAIRLNEYYVSQYVDHTPLEHPRHGVVVASRQNQPMGGRCPWLVIGSLNRGVSFATDALQFHRLATRAGQIPAALLEGLPGSRLQHEHSQVGIQDQRFVLAPGATTRRGFFAWFEPDKPAATGPGDLKRVDDATALPEALAQPARDAGARASHPAPGWFAGRPLLDTRELDRDALAKFFPGAWRHEETVDGRLLSFFTGDRWHVVTKAKELRVLRPHGHILRSGGLLTPDETSLTSTVWMAGVFHSMVTQGHVSINRFLSTCHGYLGLFRSHGQRVFIETPQGWKLLDVPSAFAVSPHQCRWLYQHDGGLVEVRSQAAADRHELHLRINVLQGPPARFLISHHVALNGDDGNAAGPALWQARGKGIFLRPAPDSDVGRRFPAGGFAITPDDATVIELTGGDEMLFPDGQSRRQPWVCLRTAATRGAGLTITGELLAPAAATPAANLGAIHHVTATGPQAAAMHRLVEIHPWFVHNALVHYLSPRGLEQYSGGGWGTRDVCQGPVELLLAMAVLEPLRDLLLRVYRQQNPDGDWPQWFMFFERERLIRPGDSHGDIVYWPVLALAQYVIASGDASILDERVPFFTAEGAAEPIPLRQHVERALELMRRRVIAGTRLAAYGHGDWNDALQPARPEMRDHLCSSWTVTLCYQTYRTLAEAFNRCGEPRRAQELQELAAMVLDQFQSLLLPDGVIAGLMDFHDEGTRDPLLHPRDHATGISYSLLPMIHAIINDMLSPAQAEQHLAIIRTQLAGPDGAHLFDHPLAYRGGLQTFFQRAESASYFGREIGIMYMHAHLRYCEALAHTGDAEGFFRGLCQANPIAIRAIVPSAALRQANCYYSSSDPAFADRYHAFDEYDKVGRGEVPLEGGWRVYSSGAGIAVALIVHGLLGIRLCRDAWTIDPVLPKAFDGMEVALTLGGVALRVTYQIGGRGCGVGAVDVNGTPVAFTRQPNPYRRGAARIAPPTATNGPIRLRISID